MSIACYCPRPPCPCLTVHPWPPAFHPIPTFEGEQWRGHRAQTVSYPARGGEADTSGLGEACWQDPEKQKMTLACHPEIQLVCTNP